MKVWAPVVSQKIKGKKNKKGDFGLRPLTFGVSFGFFFFFVG
jgi:hypothetical protein